MYISDDMKYKVALNGNKSKVKYHKILLNCSIYIIVTITFHHLFMCMFVYFKREKKLSGK